MIKAILKSKYKMFHFINLLYYGISFGLGYCVGVGYGKVFDFFRKIMGV